MKYTKIEMIEEIRRFYKENGRIPTSSDFCKKNGYPSRATLAKYFGSWNSAIKEAGFDVNRMNNLTDQDLLDYLIQFEKEFGRIPTPRDLNFGNYPNYPSMILYIKRFGSFEKARKLIGQDFDTKAKKGILDHPKQKARLAEIFVMEHFKEEGAIDLAGENCNNHVDGICPKKQIYDVKSSCCNHIYGRSDYWGFALDKGPTVDFYYLLGFNEDWSELLHVWRIPWDYTDAIHLQITIYKLQDMKKYEIIEKFMDVFNKWKESMEIENHV